MTTKILAIETSTSACSVACGEIGKNPCHIIEIAPNQHSKILLEMVDKVCNQAKINKSDLSAIAYSHGPGSFTGLRIASSAAQGLALGLDIPLISVSSLEALKLQAAKLHPNKYVIPILDARMQEIYVQLKNEDQLLNPSELSLDVNLAYLAVGTGAKEYYEILKQNLNLIFDLDILYPMALEVFEIAAQKFSRGQILQPQDALPIYLRNNVAAKTKKNPD